ncbi:MAG: tetratricopeptide repeat protein [Lewinellaceae bacterium]|nr:tetratricopeptide repeat protein [Lewinellaceae bacterium]
MSTYRQWCQLKDLAFPSSGFVLVLVLLSAPLSGQSPLDSLRRVATSANDTLRINALNQLAQFSMPDSLEQAEQFANKALAEAKKIRYTKGIIYAWRYKGLAADFGGDLDKAIACYDEALRITEVSDKWKREEAGLLVNKGVAYFFAGDMGRALEFYLLADPLFDEIDDESAHAKLLNNLAVVYRQLNRYEDAIRIYQKSIIIKEKINDRIGIANSTHNIGLVYGYMNDYPNTVRYLEKARQQYEDLQEWSEAQSVYLSLGNAFFEMGRMEEAKAAVVKLFASESLDLTLFEQIQARLLRIKVSLADKDFNQAEQWLEEIEPVIFATTFSKAKSTFFELKAYVFHGLQQHAESYEALLMHKQYLDTLQSEERVRQEKDMETKYLTKEKENLIQIQQLELQKNQRERIAYILALLALSLILLLAYRFARLRKKANRLLQEKNLQIEKALGEKELLLKEIHHRVKNNLQIISSLLSLQSRQIEDPKALEAIQEGRNRVNSMALIHKNLYQDEDLVGVDAGEYIEKLTESLITNYNINPKQVVIAKDIDPMKLDVDTIIPLGLILNELISNSLKYAFSDGQAGKMFVSLKREEDGLRLRVADNGRGLPANLDVENLKSLGFRLVKAFTQKLEGELSIQSDRGTSVEICIPKFKAA